jgi:aspartyl aminopeptidase
MNLDEEIERIQGIIENVEEDEEVDMERPRVEEPAAYTEPFRRFLSDNPTVFHAVEYFAKKLRAAGFREVGLLISSRG